MFKRIKKWLRRKCKMKKGDIVIYCDRFDADPSDGTPNTSPAIVVEINESGTLDLMVFFLNGVFHKQSCEKGEPNERGKWSERG